MRDGRARAGIYHRLRMQTNRPWSTLAANAFLPISRGYGSKRSHRKSANRLPDLRSDPQVASRLPGCKKVCSECGGTGHVNFKRRQQLPAKVKAKERGLSGRFDQYCALESSLMAHHSDPRP